MGSPALSGIDHLAIRVDDLARALALFVDALGFELGRSGRGGPDAEIHFAFVRRGNLKLELFEDPEAPAAACLDHVGLAAAGGLGEATARLRRAGIAPEGAPLPGSDGGTVQRLDPATTLGIRLQICAEEGGGGAA